MIWTKFFLDLYVYMYIDGWVGFEARSFLFVLIPLPPTKIAEARPSSCRRYIFFCLRSHYRVGCWYCIDAWVVVQQDMGVFIRRLDLIAKKGTC